MPQNREKIRNALISRLDGATRIAVLAVGSDLRGDDAAGLIAAERLVKDLARCGGQGKRIKVFMGATAPENLTGEIRRFLPSHLIVIDAVDRDKPAGTAFFFDPATLEGGVSFSTHTIPAKILIDYLTASFACTALVIGIQPKTIEFGKKVSPPVAQAARRVAAMIASAICKGKGRKARDEK